ncbi:uncharacterized protein LOC122512542 [Leptopilina heterotoma]|uniref:uncharacterized protein LOC122512542 n=1 Tax=Leptopilina heterotoma TaxID=63436 RepID=UPI001CA9B059|nr:uncharacterized protein LOC122512542 [Leptopilina heterotoma]
MKKTRLIFVMFWLLLLLVASAEGTIFEYSKNALIDFFQSLRDKKGDQKLWNVHHYHVHYYPTPLEELNAKPLHAPEKSQLNELHSESLRSMGWTDHEYPVPDPKVIFPSKAEENWPKPSEENSRKMWSWDNNVFETKPVLPVEHQPVLVQVPIHQQIVFQQPPIKEEKKLTFLAALFQKLRRITKALFHVEKPHDDCDDRKDVDDNDHSSSSAITNKLNSGYVVYLNSKANQRV